MGAPRSPGSRSSATRRGWSCSASSGSSRRTPSSSTPAGSGAPCSSAPAYTSASPWKTTMRQTRARISTRLAASVISRRGLIFPLSSIFQKLKSETWLCETEYRKIISDQLTESDDILYFSPEFLWRDVIGEERSTIPQHVELFSALSFNEN